MVYSEESESESDNVSRKNEDVRHNTISRTSGSPSNSKYKRTVERAKDKPKPINGVSLSRCCMDDIVWIDDPFRYVQSARRNGSVTDDSTNNQQFAVNNKPVSDTHHTKSSNILKIIFITIPFILIFLLIFLSILFVLYKLVTHVWHNN